MAIGAWSSSLIHVVYGTVVVAQNELIGVQFRFVRWTGWHVRRTATAISCFRAIIPAGRRARHKCTVDIHEVTGTRLYTHHDHAVGASDTNNICTVIEITLLQISHAFLLTDFSKTLRRRYLASEIMHGIWQ